MDRITLQHYQERAAKAQALVDRIERITKEIKNVKKTLMIRLIHNGEGHNIELGQNSSGKLANVSSTEMVARMLNVFIDMSLQEIRQLEAELAEL